ncbi:MAG: hypothetical protein JWP29_3486 [Rhodoferax sp.]|nr:hypothetical protein [Rhodoferax sp.]
MHFEECPVEILQRCARAAGLIAQHDPLGERLEAFGLMVALECAELADKSDAADGTDGGNGGNGGNGSNGSNGSHTDGGTGGQAGQRIRAAFFDQACDTTLPCVSTGCRVDCPAKPQATPASLPDVA